MTLMWFCSTLVASVNYPQTTGVFRFFHASLTLPPHLSEWFLCVSKENLLPGGQMESSLQILLSHCDWWSECGHSGGEDPCGVPGMGLQIPHCRPPCCSCSRAGQLPNAPQNEHSRDKAKARQALSYECRSKWDLMVTFKAKSCHFLYLRMT